MKKREFIKCRADGCRKKAARFYQTPYYTWVAGEMVLHTATCEQHKFWSSSYKRISREEYLVAQVMAS